MDVKDMPESWFAPGEAWWTPQGEEKPGLLVYVDDHPWEGYRYPIYEVAEALKELGLEPRFFGPLMGALEGYRLTRKEFEERERGLTPLLFLCHGATFEYSGRTFSVKDSAFMAPDAVHLRHRLLRHDMDFCTIHDKANHREYLFNEMIDRLGWLLAHVARAVLGTETGMEFPSLILRPRGSFWQERDIVARRADLVGRIVHVFVGVPVTADTLPFWVRFLLRIAQRGGSPVLGGPHGEALNAQLKDIWGDKLVYPFTSSGVADVYYAVISAPTDYKLETAAREHALTSGARTLQWIKGGPGFFTGMDWYRTFRDIEYFDPIRDMRFPTYDRSYLFNAAYVPNTRVHPSESIPLPSANANGDVLPPPPNPLPEPMKHESKEPPMSKTSNELTETEVADVWDYVRAQVHSAVAGTDPVVTPHLEHRITDILNRVPQQAIKASSGEVSALRAYLRGVIRVSYYRVGHSAWELLRAVIQVLPHRMKVQEEIRKGERTGSVGLGAADALLLACIPGPDMPDSSQIFRFREAVEEGLMKIQPFRGAPPAGSAKAALGDLLGVETAEYYKGQFFKEMSDARKVEKAENPAGESKDSATDADQRISEYFLKVSDKSARFRGVAEAAAEIIKEQRRGIMAAMGVARTPVTVQIGESDDLTGAASIAAAEDARILKRLLEGDELATASEFYTPARTRRVWGIVARAQAKEGMSRAEEQAIVADFKAAMGTFLPQDVSDAEILSVLRKSKLPPIMVAVQKIRERHLGPVEELSRIAQLEITEVEDAKLFGGIDEALASEDVAILKHLREKEEREGLQEIQSELASIPLGGDAPPAAEGKEWIERWVSDERVPPPTVPHVPTVLVFASDTTSLLHPAFLHALGEHFRVAGYRMLVLPAPDVSFRRSKDTWAKEHNRRNTEFLRELKGDISAVLHVAWGNPSADGFTQNFTAETVAFLRALPYSGKGALEVMYLEARKLRSSRYNLVDAAAWQLDADAAAYLFRSLLVLHDVLWNNATEDQQRRWPLPSEEDAANKVSFSMFPVQQASTFLPVAVAFPGNCKEYSLRKARNLARFFRGLGMEILPVSDTAGIATRDDGEFASILARHYTRQVPRLVFTEGDQEDDAARRWDAPLNWRTVNYPFTKNKEQRLLALEEFLKVVQDSLREGSPHYASREKFRMDWSTTTVIDAETSEPNPND